MFIVLTKIDTRAYREDEGDAPKLVKVAINADRIRCLNPRREGAGTRLTFADGGGFAVQEEGADILVMLGNADLAAAYQRQPVAPVVVAAAAPEGEALN